MRSKFAMSFIILVLFSFVPTVFAQDDTDTTRWKTPIIIDFTTNQAAYSDSWTGGEAGSVNWASNLNAIAEKQLSSKFHFKSTLKLSFGQTITQDSTKEWSDPQKSTDLIDWENVGRLTLNSFVDPYAAFRVESQFYDGSVIAKKRYLSPILITESAGFAKKVYNKNNKEIITRLGFALRQLKKTVILDTLLLTTTDSTLTDGGLESVSDATFKFNDKLSYSGKLTLYKAFFFSKSDEVKGTVYEDDWKAIDINWENILNAQVSKVITVNFYAQLLYDKEISKKGRFKETVAIGFVYKFM